MKSNLLLMVLFGCLLSFSAFAMQGLKALELSNVRQPSESLITGGQPSQADFKRLADSGVKTIINMRTEDEFDDFDQAAAAKALGITYLTFPISGKTGITKQNAIKLDGVLKQTQGKVLLHCGSGNRVGALLALRAFYVEGKSADEAITDGKAAGMTRLSKKVEKMLK